MTLLVLYTERLEECRAFYEGLGFEFVREKHGTGPEHFAAVLPGGLVLELYPSTPERATGRARLGFAATVESLPPGHQILTDPDGRTVELTNSTLAQTR
jgi:catechol 2,3-dioxygenase-like lactoylglutathione lyase family enzyme